ncbi:hypothetical protein F511_23434 [Dorcoceras hygrometricum]|uniref:Uncharacterized protein n=1 Tax=Dorcoceras hygrometricum TaxID=472368 RepID=A0A2Z7DK23_9LAMI|nr:hypothetical protein F511_23434 [Dorcoceras hygrometricum]
MSPSVFSVMGVGTSSFGLVGTTEFWISEGDSAVSFFSFQLCERSDVALLSDVGYHGYSSGRGVDPTGGAPGAQTWGFNLSVDQHLEYFSNQIFLIFIHDNHRLVLFIRTLFSSISVVLRSIWSKIGSSELIFSRAFD